MRPPPRSHQRSRTRSRSPTDYRSSRYRRQSPERPYRDSEPSAKLPSRSPDRPTQRYRNGETANKENKSIPGEDPEEERERKKLERKLREKELAYRARLKVWEEREEKKRRQYLVEKKGEMQKRKVVLKEAKKLRQFLEDYEDEKDDSTFYKGSSLEKKLKFREKEIELDNRDRQREKEELEELKKKLAEKGLTDVELEAKRIQHDENLRMKTKFERIEQSSSSSEDESDVPSDSEKPAVPQQTHHEADMHVDSVKADNEPEDLNQNESNAFAETPTMQYEQTSYEPPQETYENGYEEQMNVEITAEVVTKPVIVEQETSNNNHNENNSFSEDSNSPYNQGNKLSKKIYTVGLCILPLNYIRINKFFHSFFCLTIFN